MAAASIQVQTTIINGGGATAVPMADKKATHWSLYVRDSDGTVSWVCDFALKDGNAQQCYTKAMVEAAKLSMEHQVPIEKVE